MNPGDKLYCIDTFFESVFKVNSKYTISIISITNIDYNVFFKEFPNYVVNRHYIDRYFCTEKEYRKLKLEKICSK